MALGHAAHLVVTQTQSDHYIEALSSKTKARIKIQEVLDLHNKEEYSVTVVRDTLGHATSCTIMLDEELIISAEYQKVITM